MPNPRQSTTAKTADWIAWWSLPLDQRMDRAAAEPDHYLPYGQGQDVALVCARLRLCASRWRLAIGESFASEELETARADGSLPKRRNQLAGCSC